MATQNDNVIKLLEEAFKSFVKDPKRFNLSYPSKIMEEEGEELISLLLSALKQAGKQTDNISSTLDDFISSSGDNNQSTEKEIKNLKDKITSLEKQVNYLMTFKDKLEKLK